MPPGHGGPEPAVRNVRLVSPKPAFDQSITEIADTIFEPRLRELGLAVDQIQEQSLQELQDSLERVNDAISNPQSFGEVSVKISADAGVVIARSTSEGQLTVGILPLLLDRKRLILSRIRELGGRNAEELLERLASGKDGAAGSAQQAAAEALEQLRVARTAGDQAVELDRELVRQRELVAIYERKAKVWQSFLARESIASIAGGLLLLVLGISLIVAMFVGTTPTDVVTNAFLLILGYFFGQSVARERAERKETGGGVHGGEDEIGV